jgi:hypothetical protein
MDDEFSFGGYNWGHEDLLQDTAADGPEGRVVAIWARPQLVQSSVFEDELLRRADAQLATLARDSGSLGEDDAEVMQALKLALLDLYTEERAVLAPLLALGPRTRPSALAERLRAC